MRAKEKIIKKEGIYRRAPEEGRKKELKQKGPKGR